MTAATPGSSGPNLFSLFSNQEAGSYRTRREAFAASLLGQAAILAVVVYLTSIAIVGKPPLIAELANLKRLPVVYSGNNGGGGGNFDPLPASTGNLPQAALMQIVPPTVMRPTRMPLLAVPETIEIAPDVKIPQGGVSAILCRGSPRRPTAPVVPVDTARDAAMAWATTQGPMRARAPRESARPAEMV